MVDLQGQLNDLFKTGSQMQQDLTGVMGEVSRYMMLAQDSSKIDPTKLDMTRVKVPQGVFDKVT